MTIEDEPQAAWVRDGDQWRVLVPTGLAKAGQRVLVARKDGSRLRQVVVGEVTTREWKGKIVCTIDHGRER